jgi:tryptophan synthase alpha chain
MSRISGVFRNKKHKALIAYITAGYPDAEATVRAALLLAESGCDIIELGIPFSDPMADGLTIQYSSHLALLNGVTTRTCFEIAGRISSKRDVPLVFMTYLNPVIKYGVERFCADCSAVKVDGLIIPDLPPGELPAYDAAAKEYGIDTIYFVAPNSAWWRNIQVDSFTWCPLQA